MHFHHGKIYLFKARVESEYIKLIKILYLLLLIKSSFTNIFMGKTFIKTATKRTFIKTELILWLLHMIRKIYSCLQGTISDSTKYCKKL